MRNKILFVDDDAALRGEMPLLLREYDVIVAASAEEALAVLAAPNEIDLILMDVHMSGMGGLAALEKVHAAAPGIGVIIMTGYSSKDVSVQALRGHAAGYIEKPFDVPELRALVAKELAGRLPPPDGDARARVEHVKRYVEANCFKKITLSDAAAAVFLTPKYLSRIFREHAGMGFTEYKLKVKVEKAQAILKSGAANIKQVSASLGYANTESFIRQFSKIAGCLPSSFRKAGGCRLPRRPPGGRA